MHPALAAPDACAANFWVPRTSLLALALAAACSKPPVEQYRTDAVSKGPITEVVSATGGVEAIQTINIGSQVSGTIQNLFVDFNTLVKKGQLLAEIDPRLFRASAERAEGGYASAKAQVERAEAVLADARRVEARATELFNGKLTSRADLDTAAATREQAQASLSIAKAGVLQAKADRDTAFANLAYTKITSPIDGIVVSRSIDRGQTVAASFQTPTLFTIANDLTKMQILANIDEADVGKVREQMETRFTVDAWPGETFAGRIREVRQAPTTIQNVVTYAAVIDAPNPERKLRQGMTASVQITTGKREEVLRVPNAALRFKPSVGSTDGAGNSAGKPEGKGDKAVAAGSGSGSSSGKARGVEASGERGGLRGEKGWGSGREPRGDGAPREAGDPGGRKVSRPGKIYKLVDGKPVGVQVRLGLGDSQRTEVLEGLAENDVVIVGELGAMQSGQSRSPVAGGPPGGGGMRRGF